MKPYATQTCIRCGKELGNDAAMLRVSFYRLPPYLGRSELLRRSDTMLIHGKCADDWVRFRLAGAA